MKKTDMICAGILVLSAIGHAFGSYIAYKSDPMTLLWALSASFAVLLLAAINLLRANPTPRAGCNEHSGGRPGESHSDIRGRFLRTTEPPARAF